MRTLLILVLLVFSSGLCAQYYITVDKDGFSNIREKPNIGSRVIDRMERHEVFLFAGAICTNDTLNFDKVPTNWMAVTKGQYMPIGYLYKKNIRSLNQLRQLPQPAVFNPSMLTCSDGRVSVELQLKQFDPDQHDIVSTFVEDDHLYFGTIGGEYPKGIGLALPIVKGKVSTFGTDDKEIVGLLINYSGRRISLPIDAIKSYFNPRMTVFIGFDDELYILISSGDGGESYSVMLSVVDGVIKYIRDVGLC